MAVTTIVASKEKDGKWQYVVYCGARKKRFTSLDAANTFAAYCIVHGEEAQLMTNWKKANA